MSKKHADKTMLAARVRSSIQWNLWHKQTQLRSYCSYIVTRIHVSKATKTPSDFLALRHKWRIFLANVCVSRNRETSWNRQSHWLHQEPMTRSWLGTGPEVVSCHSWICYPQGKWEQIHSRPWIYLKKAVLPSGLKPVTKSLMNREPKTLPDDNSQYSGPWLRLAGLYFHQRKKSR